MGKKEQTELATKADVKPLIPKEAHLILFHLEDVVY